MGGDHAPEVNLEGARLAVEEGFATPDEIVLVGQAERLREHATATGGVCCEMEVVDAPDVLDPGDEPSKAMRRSPRNSIAVGIGLLQEGRGEAFVSAGSTGVVAATASLVLGTLEGIRRPGIGIVIKGERGPFLVVDVGANPQPKPHHLLQYALMGVAYLRDTFGNPNPRVGLLNIGSEEKKGNPLTREAAELLRGAARINFIGNVEGVELFHGGCDVVVCDGFTGNVLIKSSEGLAEHVMLLMARTMAEVGVAAETIHGVVERLKPKLDYSAYGGALLLGANGVVTICHGRSSAAAICNAIRFAKQAVGAKVNEHIVAFAREASAAS